MTAVRQRRRELFRRRAGQCRAVHLVARPAVGSAATAAAAVGSAKARPGRVIGRLLSRFIDKCIIYIYILLFIFTIFITYEPWITITALLSMIFIKIQHIHR